MKNSYLPAIFLAFLTTIVAWLRLFVQNDFVLLQFQEQQLFISGWEFLFQTLHQAGGLFTWLGLFLQQFLFYPALGAGILILIWMAAFFISVCAFNLRGPLSVVAVLPVVGLMCTLICTGYWIYVLKTPEYAFTPSLIYLSAMILTLLFRRMRWRLLWQSVICIVFLLYGLWWLKNALVPSGLRPPFYLVFFSAFLLPLFSFAERWIDKLFKGASVIAVIVASLFVWFYSDANNFRSDAYRTEMLMSSAIENGEWQKALDYADAMESNGSDTKVTRQIWLMRQIALMNLGKMGTDLFKYENKTVLPRATAGAKVHLVEVGGPLIYFMNGSTHFAYRWCIENMVEHGPSVACLKLMARCSIVNGEDDLARKYLGLLSQTLFHREWAQRQSSEDEACRMCRSFQRDLKNSTEGDNGLCELFLIGFYAGMNDISDPGLIELCLNYSMIQRNPKNFWRHFANYLASNQGKEIPVHYQEAAVLFSMMEPKKVPSDVDMNSLALDPSLFTSFGTMIDDVRSNLEKGEPLEGLSAKYRSQFGKTYFWYYLFCVENKTY